MQDDDFKPLQPVDLTPTERVSELADRGNLIHASNDVEAVVAWLLEYRNHPKPTRAAYYRQAQRLLLWLRHKAHKTLREMGREDWREYEDFMLDPQPEDVWCGPSRPRSHPEWRPFRGPLDRSSHRTAMSILNGMVGFLVEAGYLKANPLSLRRMRHVESRPKVERFLDEKA